MESTFVMVQLQPLPDPKDNLKKAQDMAEKAVQKFHPDFLLFPETFSSEFAPGSTIEERCAAAEPLDGPFVTGMRKLAADCHAWMAFGMKETVEDPEDHRCYNSVVLVDDKGEIVQVYRKTHLYDAFGYKESDEFKEGDHLFEPVDTPFGKIGLFVCYEVRFPEVARHLRAHGADILLMPTAWVKGDLKSLHFRTLITARAIENTVYMLACDMCGGTRLGESVAVDPMGVPIASAGETEALIPVYIDTQRIEEVRRKLPSYGNRRPEMYTD